MSEFSVSKDMKRKAVDFGRWEINNQEGGAPSLQLQVQWNPCFIGKEATARKVAAHLCLTLIVKELKISVEKISVKQNRVKVDNIEYN